MRTIVSSLGSVVAVLVAVSLAPSVATAQQAFKMGYVDYYRVINESEDGKKANDALKREFDPIKEDIKAREAEIKRLGDELEKQKGVLSAQTLQEKEDALKLKYSSYMRAKQSAKEKFSERNSKLLKPIMEDLRSVVKDVGAQGNYTIIFEKSLKEDELVAMEDNILYVSPGIDITSDVLKAFNAKRVASKAAAPKPAPAKQ